MGGVAYRIRCQRDGVWGRYRIVSNGEGQEGRLTHHRTAYRIWTGGWGSIVNSDDPHDSEPLPTQEYDDMYNDTNEAESLPPLPFPHSRTTHRSYSSERYATSTGSSTSPRRRHHSSPGSAYRRRRRAQRPTIAELLAITAQSPSASASTFGRALSPDSDVMSVSGFTGMTEGGPSSPTSRTTLEPITGSDGGSGSESDDETNARLAAMAQRVQGLITEGRAALSSPVSTLKSCPVQAADFPVPPPRDSPPPIDVLKPRPRSVRVSGWDKDTDTTAEERPRRASSASMVAPIMSPALGSSIGIGPPPARPTTSRPVSVGSFPRSSSVSSNSSRYQPIIPPLPWRRESVGVTSRWVQKQHSPSGSISGSSTDNTSTTRRINNGEVPLVLNRANPTTSKNRDRPESARPDSARSDSARPGSAQPDSSRHDSPHLHSPRQHDNGSRIPRPGAHSRASSVTSGTDSVVKVHPTRDLTSPLRARSSASNSSNADRAGWNSPAPPQGLVAARTSLFTTAAERNADTNTHINRSKIPISRSMGSMGSISSITAVQTPSPKA